MQLAPPSALLASAPPSPGAAPFAALEVALPRSPLAIGLIVLALLLVSTVLAMLRASLLRTAPDHVLGGITTARRRARIERLLAGADSLAASASVLKIAADLALVALLVAGVAADEPVRLAHLLVVLLPLVPVLFLVTEAVPASIGRARGAEILRSLLPAYHVVQLPIALVVRAVDSVRRAVLRALRVRDTSPDARRLVEDFRAMVELEEYGGKLEAGTRELIANAIEFRDVDAAEVMTPRTELRAVPVTAGMEDAIRVFAESGFSRIPVYEGTIDTIIGTLSAIEVAKALAEDRFDRTRLRDVMRPPLLVPETKLVSELLAEFRADRQKMAIVVDEYGGTAGLVTLADIAGEIVGDVPDEYEDDEAPFRTVGGAVEVQAAVHVSEVNEALGLDLPEEADFETLGGFVLAELGRFPNEGESFQRDGVEYAVVEASDRRVLKVSVQRPA